MLINLFKIKIEKWRIEDRNLDIWLFGNKQYLIEEYGPQLIGATIAANDFIPGTPFMTLFIPESQKQGQVFRDHYFINPIHYQYDTANIFAITDSLIDIYSPDKDEKEKDGYGYFFKHIAKQIGLITNFKMLQSLHDEKHFHLVGLVNDDECLYK